MANTVNINNVLYTETELLKWTTTRLSLFGFGTIMANGAPNPFWVRGGCGDWHVKVGPDTVLRLDDANACALEMWLAAYSIKDCPVDRDSVDVTCDSAGKMSFVVVPGPVYLAPNIHTLIHQGFIGSTKTFSNEIQIVKTAFVDCTTPSCVCGAAKTYNAGPGSSLHSNWCEVANKK